MGLSNISSDDALRTLDTINRNFADLQNQISMLAAAGGYSSALDVRAFGAKCDGLTDDTIALTSAIASAALKRQPVRISSGVLLAQSKIISSAGLTLIIDSGAVLRLKAASTSHQLSIAADDVTITGGGTLDGNSTANPNAGSGIFIEFGVRNAAIRGVVIKNSTQSNIRVKGGSGADSPYLVVDSCIFSGAGDHAVYGNWEAPYARITRNLFIGGDQNAIWFGNGSHHSQILDNQIRNYRRMGIEVWRGGNATKIRGNSVSATGNFGISVDSGDGVEVSGNYSERDPANLVESLGIEIAKTTNAHCFGNRASGWFQCGSIDQASGTVFEGNIYTSPVTADTARSLFVTTQSEIPAKENLIVGNRFVMSGAGNVRAIWAQANHPSASLDDLLIANNIFVGPDLSHGRALMFSRDNGSFARCVVQSNVFRNWAEGIQKSEDAPDFAIGLNQFSNVSNRFAFQMDRVLYQSSGQRLGFGDVGGGNPFAAGETRAYGPFAVPGAKANYRISASPTSAPIGTGFHLSAHATADGQVTAWLTNISAGFNIAFGQTVVFSLD